MKNRSLLTNAKKRRKRPRRTDPLRADPTRTATLRRRFEEELARRFAALAAEIDHLIREEDALGLGSTLLSPRSPSSLFSNPAVNQRWRFQPDPQKVREFEAWLRARVGATLQGRDTDRLWQEFIEDGYRRGAGRAFDDTRRAERLEAARQERLDFYEGSREEFLRSSFGRPVGRERVEMLAGRTLSDLKGVEEQMATRMTRVLTDGLVRGAGPEEVARDLVRETDIARGRAEAIARSEIIRSHSEGQLEALEKLGVEEVGVAVEWSTSGNNVCPACKAMEGVVLKISEARGLIPRHPNCKCAWLPNLEPEAGQKRTRKQVEAAVRRSVKAQPAAPQDWPAVARPIAEERPQGIPAAVPAIVTPAPVPAAAVTRMPDGKEIAWVPHPAADPDEHETVMVDPRRLDADWQGAGDEYLPSGAENVAGRRAGVAEFLLKGQPLQASRVALDAEGRPTFIDGRHRFAVLRDRNAPLVAVTVPRSEAEEFRRRYGASAPPAPLAPREPLRVPGARFVDEPDPDDVRRAERMLGHRPDAAELAGLAGGQEDARVSMTALSPQEVQIMVSGRGYSATRTLKKGPDGKLVLKAEQISTEAQGTRRGLGTEMFRTQVEAAERLGVAEIRATGSRGAGNVGYRVLPRWGYDGPLPRQFREQLPAALRGAETVQQLYALPGGRQWWEENGGDIVLSFDPAPGSPHRARLEAYLEGRGRIPAGPAPAPQAPRPSTEELLAQIDSLPRVPERPADTGHHGFPVDLQAPYRSTLGRWETAPVEEVPLDRLIATQAGVSRAVMKAKAQASPSAQPIKVVRMGGKLYIHDGTHQATLARLSGQTTVRALIVDVDETGRPVMNALAEFSRLLEGLRD